MIKTKKGKTKMKGRATELLADYSIITSAIVDGFVKVGISEEEAVEMVTHARSLGLMTEEEIKKEAKEKISKVLKDIASKLNEEETDHE